MKGPIFYENKVPKKIKSELLLTMRIVIELTKSEYKNFREECREVDMKLWMEEIPGMIKQHQRDARSSK
jgi:hypothetical protein